MENNYCKNFDDWWKKHGGGHSKDTRELCLDAWEDAVNGTWAGADKDRDEILWRYRLRLIIAISVIACLALVVIFK